MTKYRKMYDRQAELQRIGQLQGHRPYTAVELDLAILDELGEVNHHLKPLWAWWKKPGSALTIDADALVNEAADVLHFLLIRDLDRDGMPIYADRDIEGMAAPLSGDSLKAQWLTLSIDILTDDFDADDFICGFVQVLQAVGKTVNDLVAAYFAKTQVNLDRWAAAQ